MSLIKKEDLHDAIQIRLIDTEKNNYCFRLYFTTKFTETLKMYRYVQKEGIDILITSNDDDNPDEYTDSYANIEDIEVSFGGDVYYTTIHIYVTVRDYK